MSEKHFLVWRDNLGLWKLESFVEQGEALAAYERAESELPMLGEVEVVLLGADSLLTLCKTHSSWLCPETLEVER